MTGRFTHGACTEHHIDTVYTCCADETPQGKRGEGPITILKIMGRPTEDRPVNAIDTISENAGRHDQEARGAVLPTSHR